MSPKDLTAALKAINDSSYEAGSYSMQPALIVAGGLIMLASSIEAAAREIATAMYHTAGKQ